MPTQLYSNPQALNPYYLKCKHLYFSVKSDNLIFNVI